MSNHQKRREQEKQDRRDAILDAAEVVFCQQGYHRTSMDDIARGAMVSRALLYVYFTDKAAIQRGIMLRAAERLRERFREALDSRKTGLEQIGAMGQSYYHFYLEEPNYFAALTEATTAMQEAGEDEADTMVCSEQATMHMMVEALENGLKDGTLSRERVSDPFQTALYLRGALHGVIMMVQQEMGESGPLAEHSGDALIAHTMAMLTHSLKAD
ncbi:TetR family transcriptional regulator [Tamilnaduibacter salinus]|uniref:TetR family transcriptional regulator n=1 Tax=Tamilnaduibacter salinus TaxID=1484056 RepID=A0A2A2I4D7_9GAMM|nr:TetR/AcrR family transcriptional regulator [Tamilnaduibacter salinus]PAV26527.1 TetR family transcriptional regulator [Tamilnaduibacter salinus]PVY75909.1 TetR family transcriptional regulator [Tamilnaduibacter salinus]